MSKYGVSSGLCFPAFGLNTNAVKYGPEKTPYLDTFHTVVATRRCSEILPFRKIIQGLKSTNSQENIR